MKILVTGGLGYIGSHTVVELINQKHNIVIIDNLSNSSIDVLDRINQITGVMPIFYQIDLINYSQTKKVFEDNDFDSIIHFAGYKAVGESVSKPVMYYENNIISTINLLKLMDEFDVTKFVFSSSATVYGNPKTCPILESFDVRATNPYGRTKLFIEEILKDYTISKDDSAVSILRYFNPVGAHKSGLIGENPNGIPNNLVPYISQVANGRLDELSIFGNDYDTHDGTGVRDYIHVVDLALGHIKALDYINKNRGVHIHNLGTGKGYSVLEMVRTFEDVSKKKVPYKIVDRRPGDIATCYADPSKAKKDLNWEAKRDLKEMLKDVWHFEQKLK